VVALGEPGTPLICCALAAADNRNVSVNVAMPNRRLLMVNLHFGDTRALRGQDGCCPA
jgi:hypothetical protein